MKNWIKHLGFWVLSLGLVLSLFAPYNFAQNNLQSEAVVQSAAGRVMLLRAPWWSFWSWRSLEEGTDLVPGDRIKVGSGGELEIYFYSGSQVRVLENTTVIIGEHSLETLDADGASSIMVKSGEVWVLVEKAVSKALKFKVETPNAVAGVRGTSFIVSVNHQASSILVDEGLVEVQQKQQLAAEGVMVQAGYEVQVSGKNKPEQILPANENRRKELNKWSEKTRPGLGQLKNNQKQTAKEVEAKKDKEDKSQKDKDKEEKSDENSGQKPGSSGDQGTDDDQGKDEDKDEDKGKSS